MRTEAAQAVKDVFTPAISRIYNISPRIAWRIITMETQTDINIHRYRQRTLWFVKAIKSLKGEAAFEVKKALLDFWALASEQTEENIAQYKEEEVAKLKEVFKKYWIKEEDYNEMFLVLNELWQKYKDAWLSINLSDLYFPRTVTDYEWLIDYINEYTGSDIDSEKGLGL